MDYRYLSTRGALNEVGADAPAPAPPPPARGRRGRAAAADRATPPVGARRAAERRAAEIAEEAVAAIPESLARESLAVPLAVDGERLTVGVVDPADVALADRLTFVLNRRVHLVAVDREQILALLDLLYGRPVVTETVDSMLQEFTDTAVDACEAASPWDDADLDAPAEPLDFSMAALAPPLAASRRRAAGIAAPAPPGLDTTRPLGGSTGMFFHVVEEGQRVLARRPDGRLEVIAGPRRAWQGKTVFRPMAHHVAHPGEYLIVRYPRRPPGAPARPGRGLARPAGPPVDRRRGRPATGRQGGGRRLQPEGGHRRRPAADRVRPGPVHAPARRVAPHLLLARLEGRARRASSRSPTAWSSRSSG